MNKIDSGTHWNKIEPSFPTWYRSLNLTCTRDYNNKKVEFKLCKVEPKKRKGINLFLPIAAKSTDPACTGRCRFG